MKICPKCKKKYVDDFSFCNYCGCELDYQKIPYAINRNIVLAIIIVAVVAIGGIGFAILGMKNISDIRKDIVDSKYNKALEMSMNTPTTSDIIINDDWVTERDIDYGYIYITGTVTNTSYSKTIGYYAVEAKFYDKYGNVIDSDWTNDGQDLAPGESRKFRIMHKYSSDEKDIKLSIKDVR